ncbi:TetR/AcrR family transcriptional regulator [soil metagenome]
MNTRSDSARNREALIAAARTVFEMNGIDAPLENVAAAAGLSRTSLHRHFASRAELIAAIWAADVAETEADVARFGGRPDAFIAVFDRTLLQQVDRRSIHPTTAQIESADIVALAARFVAAIQTAVATSRAAGVLRADVTDTAGVRAVGMAIYGVWNVLDRADRFEVFSEVRGVLLRGLLDAQWLADHPDVIEISARGARRV